MATFYDVEHPSIVAAVRHLECKTNGRNPRDFITNAFNFVRNGVKYTWMLDWTQPAHVTLETKRGNCFNKACLLYTLLKAADETKDLSVDFLLATLPVEGIVYRMAPDWVWNHFPSQQSPHAVVVVSVPSDDGGLFSEIILDPTVDYDLAIGMKHYGNPAFADLDPNSTFCASPAFLRFKPKRYNSIENFLLKKPSYGKGLVVLMEASAHFLRNYRPICVEAPDAVGRALEAYLWSQAGPVTKATVALPPRFVRSSSKFVDPGHPAVQKLAARLRRRADASERKFAILAFQWVRDTIPYFLQHDWSVPVEHTMTIRQGMCSTKCCLLVSLLRAGGLQAGFYVQPQNATHAFVAPSWILQKYSSHSIHILAAVRFGQSDWIKLDPMIDFMLGTSMDRANLVYQPGYSCIVHFDGYRHALLGPNDDVGVTFFDNIDHFMSKKSQVPVAVIHCHNICLELIRMLGPIFSSEEEVLLAMEQHLHQVYPELVSAAMKSGNRTKPVVSPNSILRVSDQHLRQVYYPEFIPETMGESKGTMPNSFALKSRL